MAPRGAALPAGTRPEVAPDTGVGYACAVVRRLLRSLASALALIVLGGCFFPLPDFDNPIDPLGRFAGDGNAIPAVEAAWTFDAGFADTYASPAIGPDGTIYLGGSQAVYALSSSGSVAWTFPIVGSVEHTPAVDDDGTVYVGSDDSTLYAINPDGSEKWQYFASRDLDSKPAIGNNGTIYVVGESGDLVAMNPDGTLAWTVPTSAIEHSSPAVHGDTTVYVPTINDGVHAIATTPSIQWTHAAGEDIRGSSPAIASDGTVYLGTAGGEVIALAPDGNERWRFSAPRESVRSSPAIAADGTVYVGSDDGGLYAIDSDGSERWRFEMNGQVLSSPAIAVDGTVYAGSDDGGLYALHPDGSPKWRLETDGAVSGSPVIGNDGTVYVSSRSGILYAVPDDTGGPATAQWPMFGGGPGRRSNASGDGGPSGSTSLVASVANPACTSGPASLTVSWTDPPAAELDHIALAWSPGGSAGVTVPPGTESYVVTGLSPGTSYTFTLVAVDTGGVGAPAVSATGIPDTDPGPAWVTLLGEVPRPFGRPGGVNDAALYSSHLYLAAEGGGVKVLDVSAPFSPAYLGPVNVAFPTHVEVEGDYLYVTDPSGTGGGMHILSLASPSSPSDVSHYNVDDVRLVEPLPGGDVAIVARSSGIDVMDTAAKSSPTLLTSIPAPFDVTSMASTASFVFMGGSSTDILAYDLSDPSAPSLVGTVPGPFGDFALAGNYVYASTTSGLDVIDVSDPATAAVVNGSGVVPLASSVSATGGELYVTASETLYSVDISSDPLNPSVADSLAIPDVGNGTAFAAAGGSGYLATRQGAAIIDTSTLSALTQTGFLDTAGRARSIVVDGGLLAFSDDEAGVRLFDVSTPSMPTEIDSGHIYSDSIARDGIQLMSSTLYFAAGDLYIYDVSSPTSPVLIAQQPTAGAHALHISGSYAYVAGWGSAVEAYDISNPSSPSLIGQSSTTPYAREILPTSSGQELVVIDEYYGIRIYDISDPAAISQVGSYDVTPYRLTRAYLYGNTLYATDSGAMRIFDLTDPANPTLVQTMTGPGMSVAGNGSLLATPYGIFDMSNPLDPVEVHDGSLTEPASDMIMVGDTLFAAGRWSVDDRFLRIYDVTLP